MDSTLLIRLIDEHRIDFAVDFDTLEASAREWSQVRNTAADSGADIVAQAGGIGQSELCDEARRQAQDLAATFQRLVTSATEVGAAILEFTHAIAMHSQRGREAAERHDELVARYCVVDATLPPVFLLERLDPSPDAQRKAREKDARLDELSRQASQAEDEYLHHLQEAWASEERAIARIRSAIADLDAPNVGDALLWQGQAVKDWFQHTVGDPLRNESVGGTDISVILGHAQTVLGVAAVLAVAFSAGFGIVIGIGLIALAVTLVQYAMRDADETDLVLGVVGIIPTVGELRLKPLLEARKSAVVSRHGRGVLPGWPAKLAHAVIGVDSANLATAWRAHRAVKANALPAAARREARQLGAVSLGMTGLNVGSFVMSQWSTLKAWHNALATPAKRPAGESADLRDPATVATNGALVSTGQTTVDLVARFIAHRKAH